MRRPIYLSRSLAITLEHVGQESEAKNEVREQFGAPIDTVFLTNHLLIFSLGDGPGVEHHVDHHEDESHVQEQTFFDLRLTVRRVGRKN